MFKKRSKLLVMVSLSAFSGLSSFARVPSTFTLNKDDSCSFHDALASASSLLANPSSTEPLPGLYALPRVSDSANPQQVMSKVYFLSSDRALEIVCTGHGSLVLLGMSDASCRISIDPSKVNGAETQISPMTDAGLIKIEVRRTDDTAALSNLRFENPILSTEEMVSVTKADGTKAKLPRFTLQCIPIMSPTPTSCVAKLYTN